MDYGQERSLFLHSKSSRRTLSEKGVILVSIEKKDYAVRCFYLAEKISGRTVSISDAGQLHHIRNVLRLKTGEEVSLFDSEGNEYTAAISAIGKNQAILSLKSCRTAGPKRLKIAIACVVPKLARMDEIIDKLTQLGVDCIIPLETERSIVRLDKNDRSYEERFERWRKIARSAAEQSHRNILPEISRVLSLTEALGQSPGYEFKLVATLEGERKTLNEILAGSRPASIFVLIGPEGDFTPSEIELAIKGGFTPVSLGESVLRVDTAAIALASYFKFTLME
jgi:16S rRNA (uracil1498-N3)-methyltransferase